MLTYLVCIVLFYTGRYIGFKQHENIIHEEIELGNNIEVKDQKYKCIEIKEGIE